jgi:hypothetical protein
MIDQILNNTPALAVLLIINLGFFALGAVGATLIAIARKNKRIETSYNEGYQAAQVELEEEKKGFSEDVSIELAKLRDGIINSAKAYRDTLSIIETKVGFSANDKNRLTIGSEISNEIHVELLGNSESTAVLSEQVTKDQLNNDSQDDSKAEHAEPPNEKLAANENGWV